MRMMQQATDTWVGVQGKVMKFDEGDKPEKKYSLTPKADAYSQEARRLEVLSLSLSQVH